MVSFGMGDGVVRADACVQDQHLAQFADINTHWHRHFTKSIVFNNSGKYYHKTIASTIN